MNFQINKLSIQVGWKWRPKRYNSFYIGCWNKNLNKGMRLTSPLFEFSISNIPPKQAPEDAYKDYIEYSISTFDKSLFVRYGLQTEGWSNLKSKTKILDYFWNKRCVLHEYLYLDGTVAGKYEDEGIREKLMLDRTLKTPLETLTANSGLDKEFYRHIKYVDYDGEVVDTVLYKEKYVYRNGVRPWIRTMLWFLPKEELKYLTFCFSNETGPKKGSWKGGTIQASQTIEEGQTIEECIEAYKNAKRNK